MYGLPEIVWILIVGLVAGFLASMVMSGRRLSLIGCLVVGVIGAVLGWWLFGVLGITIVGLPVFVVQLLKAFVGSVILLFLLRLIR